MADGDPRAVVKGPLVDEIKGWASLWGDLLLVEMTLDVRSKLPDEAVNLFARRALWEGAVTDYWRTANSGRRNEQINDLVTDLGEEAEQCHEEIKSWRNTHVAHRVDQDREKAQVRLVLDPGTGGPKSAEVQVAPVLGPEEEPEDLAQRAVAHVRALKDLVWQGRIRPLEERLLKEHQASQGLLDIAKAFRPLERRFSIMINPSGEAET